MEKFSCGSRIDTRMAPIVCLLKSSLYSLKQSPRCWNKRFGKFIKNLGFFRSQQNPCVYIRTTRRNEKLAKVITGLYIEDTNNIKIS